MDTLPLSTYTYIRDFVGSLDHSESKPCIALVRYGIIPSPLDSQLWDSIPMSLLLKLFHLDNEPIPTEIGTMFFQVSTNPLISSSIISLVLSKVPPEASIENSFLTSVSKEVHVMEGLRPPQTVNWKIFFEPKPGDCFVLPHQEVDKTSRISYISARFRKFRDSIRFSRIWPYGTSRGVAIQTQRALETLRSYEDVSWMLPEDFRRQISSLDVVKHYIRNGTWAGGSCELKQKWYPAHLVPRTYFAQGGDAIRVSCYLRNFFNDFTDTYIPTERRARVDGSRLICPLGGHFFIYDLTSFTSNFHEQTSFLRAMADFFRGTVVFLVGYKLSLSEEDLGDLIDSYCEEINQFPTYTFHESILDFSLDGLTFIHHVAGFLGVPGNLATCTLPHGIAIGLHIESDDNQSCAGDDGNVGIRSESEEKPLVKTIHTLGVFNDDKASSTKKTGRGSYLKRPFKQIGQYGQLTERVDYPLMGSVNCMTFPDPRFPKISEDLAQLRKSIATSVSKLFRDLYAFSLGYFHAGVLEYVLFFLKDVYAKAQLPTSGMVRGLYGSDLDLESFRIDAAVVFPLSERYFRRDPDIVLIEDFLPWAVEVPVWTDEIIVFRNDECWGKGEERIGRSSATLERLCKLGYLEREETQRITLVGEEARGYFRRFTHQDFERQEYKYTSLSTLSVEQLLSVGLCGLDEFSWKQLFWDSLPLPKRQVMAYRSRDAEFVLKHRQTALISEDMYD